MLADRQKCTACAACVSICGVNAIKMEHDINGFLFPEIDEQKCVECGLCSKVCPFLEQSAEVKCVTDKLYYFGWNLDDEIRYSSSSGGVMSALADVYLKEGYVIFGAVWDAKRKKVCVQGADNESYKLQRKSKYVEAEIGDAFINVFKILSNDGRAVYVGTSCQIKGLKKYLSAKGVGADNIIYVDFVCHGVPSSGQWIKHVEKLAGDSRRIVDDIDFRNKKLGWMDNLLVLKIGRRKKMFHAYNDTYYNGFLESITLREGCYTCAYRTNFEGDITLGDFWGIDNYKKSLNDDKGISIICINNKKGADVFEKIKGKLYYESVPEKYVQYIYKDIFEDGILLKKRNEFFSLSQEIGFDKAAMKIYMKNPLIVQLKFVLKRIMRTMKINYRNLPK